MEDIQYFRFNTEGDILTGVFTYTGKPNNNDFIIPTDTMRKAVEEFQEQIDDGKALGYYSGTKSYDVMPSLMEVSHKIIDIYEKSDGSFGTTVKILDTPMGKFTKTLLDEGVDLQFNAVYIATLDDKTVCKDDFELQSIDIIKVDNG